MRHAQLTSLVLVGAFSCASVEIASAVSNRIPAHPSAYEENRLDQKSQLAFDTSLSDIVVVATIRSVTTIGIPVDTTGTRFLRVPIYTLDIQRTLKGSVRPGIIQVVGRQHATKPPDGSVGDNALPMIFFLRDIIPLPSSPTPMQRARSQYYGFMSYGVTSKAGILAPPADSMSIVEGMLTTAISAQTLEHLTSTADLVLIATVSGEAQDCGLATRRRYCQEVRIAEVYTGEAPDSILFVTSQVFRGIPRGLNLLFLRRLENGIYQVEGASAGVLWLDSPVQGDKASRLQRIQQLIQQRRATPK